MMIKKAFLWIGVAVVLGWSPGASSLPIEWSVASGGNGHFYEFVDAGQTIFWWDAKIAAEASGGHLAVVTSASENSWIITNVMVLEDPGFLVAGPWLGGYQNTSSPSYSEPAGGWEWVTGEAWSYTGWGGAEPTNGGVASSENYLHYWRWSPIHWNDTDGDTGDAFSYIVEYDTNPIPEPSTALLLGIGLSALAATRRRS